ncbi:hypothetical protein RFI_23973, partial [Reticulomyxa filosa]
NNNNNNNNDNNNGLLFEPLLNEKKENKIANDNTAMRQQRLPRTEFEYDTSMAGSIEICVCSYTGMTMLYYIRPKLVRSQLVCLVVCLSICTMRLSQLEQVMLVSKTWRPQQRPKEDAKAWWRYSAQSVINLQRKSRHQIPKAKDHVSAPIKARRSLRQKKRRYIDLYQRKMRPAENETWMPQLDEDESQELQQLEDKYVYKMLCKCL